jgi:hypothetical protein
MTYPLKEDRFSFKHFVTGNGQRASQAGRSRAVGVCISPFEAHFRSLHVAAASCQTPALDRKPGAKSAIADVDLERPLAGTRGTV